MERRFGICTLWFQLAADSLHLVADFFLHNVTGDMLRETSFSETDYIVMRLLTDITIFFPLTPPSYVDIPAPYSCALRHPALNSWDIALVQSSVLEQFRLVYRIVAYPASWWISVSIVIPLHKANINSRFQRAEYIPPLNWLDDPLPLFL